MLLRTNCQKLLLGHTLCDLNKNGKTLVHVRIDKGNLFTLTRVLDTNGRYVDERMAHLMRDHLTRKSSRNKFLGNLRIHLPKCLLPGNLSRKIEHIGGSRKMQGKDDGTAIVCIQLANQGSPRKVRRNPKLALIQFTPCSRLRLPGNSLLHASRKVLLGFSAVDQGYGMSTFLK